MKRKFHEVKAEALPSAGAGAGAAASNYQILLDGVAIKTPAGHPMMIAEIALTNAMVREWAALPLGKEIDFAALPLTGYSFALLDRIIPQREHFITAVAKKISFDLLLHPADKPAELVARQNQHWTPLVEWAERRLQTTLPINLTVIPKTENKIAEQRVIEIIESEFALPYDLLAAQQIVDICGSTILALAVLDGKITEVERLFDLAFLHEEYQLEVWGEDAEARHRLETIGDSLLELWRFLELASGMPDEDE